MDVIECLKVILFGIVEGITEWLPISSTGHMILAEEFVKLDVTPEFWNVFLVLIQLGAVLAVVVLDFKKLWPFHRKNPELPGNWNYMSANPKLEKIQIFCDNHVYMSKIVLWLKILVSCIPAIIIGLPFNDWIEAHLNNYIVVAVMLIVYGVLFIVVERYNKRRRPAIVRLGEITFQAALLIGVFQVLAVVPGTSRSGATIIGGILLGMSRKLAAEYTFFLAIPAMVGASLLKLIKAGFAFSTAEVLILLLGMAVAFVVSIVAIKFLMSYIKKHDFQVFGWYRIVLGIIVLGYFIIKTAVLV